MDGDDGGDIEMTIDVEFEVSLGTDGTLEVTSKDKVPAEYRGQLGKLKLVFR